MKKLLKNCAALSLVLILMVGVFPVSVSASVNDWADRDIKVEKTVRPVNNLGELPLEELVTRVLPEVDRPEAVSSLDIQENQHVNRLWEQEEDMSTVVFQNSDGSKSMYVFAESVKYSDENGVIRDKSNILTETIDKPEYRNDYRYVNADNDVRTYFPKELNPDTGILLEAEDIKIEIAPMAKNISNSKLRGLAQKNATTDLFGNNRNDVDYAEVLGKDITLRYTPVFNGFKEDIIIDRYTGVNEFTFSVKTNGLSVTEENGRYYLSDPQTGEHKINIGELIIYDSSLGLEIEKIFNESLVGSISDGVTAELKTKEMTTEEETAAVVTGNEPPTDVTALIKDKASSNVVSPIKNVALQENLTELAEKLSEDKALETIDVTTSVMDEELENITVSVGDVTSENFTVPANDQLSEVELEEDIQFEIEYNHRYIVDTILDKQEYLITIIVDEHYLLSEDTQYPVTVDPSFTVNSSSDTHGKPIQDASIFEVDNDYYPMGASPYNYIGFATRGVVTQWEPLETCRTLMKFPGLINSGMFKSLDPGQITKINLTLDFSDRYPDGIDQSIEVYNYTGSEWDENTVVYDSDIWDGFDDGNPITSYDYWGWFDYEARLINFDLTDAKYLWKENPAAAENGILIKCDNESPGARDITFSSSEAVANQPYITVTWNPEPTFGIDSGVYRIKNADNSFYMTAPDTDYNTSIIQSAQNSIGTVQEFYLQKLTGDDCGYYRIYLVENEILKQLSIGASNELVITNTGSPYADLGAWRATANEYGQYSFINKVHEINSGLALAIATDSNIANSPLVNDEYDNSDRFYWILELVSKTVMLPPPTVSSSETYADLGWWYINS